jgi:hypothetical protein
LSASNLRAALILHPNGTNFFFLWCRDAQIILVLKELFQVFWDNNENMNTVAGKGDEYLQFC